MIRTLLATFACIIALQCASQGQAFEDLARLEPDASTLLKTMVPASHIEARGIDQAVHQIVDAAKGTAGGPVPATYIETLGQYARPELISLDLPEATLGQQLDILSSRTDYVWVVVQGYIAFIPRGTAGDPKAIMNKVIPGKVVVSRRGGGGSSVSDWFNAHRITCAREINQLAITGQVEDHGPETIILSSPTLREYCVAFERLYRRNRCHAGIVTSQSAGVKPERTLIVSSSSVRR